MFAVMHAQKDLARFNLLNRDHPLTPEQRYIYLILHVIIDPITWFGLLGMVYLTWRDMNIKRFFFSIRFSWADE